MRSHLKVLAVLIAAFAIALAAALPALGESDAGRLAHLHDRTRSEHRLSSLARAGDLTGDAQSHAERMAARGEIYHSGRASQLDGWYALGENVGWASTVDEVFDMFMDSASHRDNILYASWDSIGVGVAPGEGGEVYVSVLFGDRAEARAAQPRRARPPAKNPAKKAPAKSQERKRVPAPAIPAPSTRATPAPTPEPSAALPAAPPPAASAPPLPAEPQPSDASRALGVLLSIEREHVAPRPTEAAAIGGVSAGVAQQRFSESDAERRRDAEASEQGTAARSLGGVARCAWSC
ncbi:MAG TPA: CAP domain-containing protein [Actinomycetota bacterium]